MPEPFERGVALQEEEELQALLGGGVDALRRAEEVVPREVQAVRDAERALVVGCGAALQVEEEGAVVEVGLRANLGGVGGDSV